MAATNNTDNLPASREAFFIRLYKKAFPLVAKYISNRGGTFDEAKDVFRMRCLFITKKLSRAI